MTHQVFCLDDFEPLARRKLPRQIFGYYAGAAETNQSKEANRSAFAALEFVPRVLVDVADRSTRTSLFGTDYAAPFGIAPMGLSSLATFDGDLVLARSARAAGIPSVLSAASLIPLERVAQETGARWFQAYLSGDAARIEALIDRVARAHYETLVVTVDVPVAANRENNVRNGFSMPLRPSLRLAVEGLTHPSWSIRTWCRTFLRTGRPQFQNMSAERGPPLLARDVTALIGQRDRVTWDHIRQIRTLWRGRLLLKGLLAPDDARRADAEGVDGIVVSNHGGRQLDGAVPALRMLPAIRAAVPALMLIADGGIRRGSDILKCLALGADFVFVGRPMLYAAAADGERGVAQAIALLKAELDRNMAMLGLVDLAAVGPAMIHPAPSVRESAPRQWPLVHGSGPLAGSSAGS